MTTLILQIKNGRKYMAQNFPPEILEEQIRECFGRIAWSHKTHEKCADILNKRHTRIKIWQMGLSAITTTGILVTILGNSKCVGIVTALVSFILTILNIYVKQYDIEGIAQKHTNTAIALWNMRENYLSLLVDIRSGYFEPETVRQKRDLFQSELLDIYRGSPRTISKAYKEATRALKQQEELTFSEEEIDSLLPKALHKKNCQDT